MSEMTPRQRVLTALARGVPDRVPFVENDVEEPLQIQIMGRDNFTPDELCDVLGLDAFGYHYPSGGQAGTGQSMQGADAFHENYYNPPKITFDFFPPWIAKMGVDAEGRNFIEKGLLVNEDSLKLFDQYLPDPDHPARYEKVAEWIAKYKGKYAVFARIRLGAASTINSMGLDNFAYAMFDNPKLIHEIHSRFSEWSARVVEHLNEMDFDFFWANDDIADNKGPWLSPDAFREFLLPHMKVVAQAIKKPWIFHSDGNLFPIMEDLLSLGMSAIHPIQPAAMDIGKMKREYGHRVCLVGNIDLDYTLTQGTPEEVEAEVKERIRVAGPGGGYILSSANSLPAYAKVENVWALARAVKKYGKYPLELD
ncbi:Uroporphyrinogen decarboxylase (URO-D) [Thermanaeromonas toyohensis ToBE]|uniref:Uroporphyrinogen decarboxylase (URO-D) n=1 Tax=Thermanaeromonas toyohensis ToBE TaxID=698762 RepID=A0A1W1W0F4_9FIRM|nr:uroporphyrinogen decarboxylase family protein [Thermanaeromonas toyohensis]SMB99066.1 Uroporphyrinogen decarboxylase (URO-D) [Thermanaeromonas toyohensis ToBE]